MMTAPATSRQAIKTPEPPSKRAHRRGATTSHHAPPARSHNNGDTAITATTAQGGRQAQIRHPPRSHDGRTQPASSHYQADAQPKRAARQRASDRGSQPITSRRDG